MLVCPHQPLLSFKPFLAATCWSWATISFLNRLQEGSQPPSWRATRQGCSSCVAASWSQPIRSGPAWLYLVRISLIHTNCRGCFSSTSLSPVKTIFQICPIIFYHQGHHGCSERRSPLTNEWPRLAGWETSHKCSEMHCFPHIILFISQASETFWREIQTSLGDLPAMKSLPDSQTFKNKLNQY